MIDMLIYTIQQSQKVFPGTLRTLPCISKISKNLYDYSEYFYIKVVKN